MAAWLAPPYTDHCPVRLVAFGVIRAVERVKAALTGDGTGTATGAGAVAEAP